MPVRSDREYRALTLACRSAEGADDDSMMVDGYATTFEEPYTLWDSGDYRVDEVIDRHAFDECDLSDVIMQYDHEGRVFARTRNSTLALSIDDHGMRIAANLGGTDIGRQLYQEIKGGYTDKMSYGFMVAEDQRTVTIDHETGKETVLRRITRISKVYDVSAVSLPANEGTAISARSCTDGVIRELTEEHRQRVAARKRLQLKLKMMEGMNYES